MKKISLLFFFVVSVFSYAQDYELTGKVIDETTREPLEASTVYAETIQDSTMVSYTVSNQNGDFILEMDTPEKKVHLFITYNGYQPVKKVVTLSKNTIDFGEIPLALQAEQLEGVSVVGERVPITIKKDTLEFNADSFKTRPDASVEDVLKKLPGVEIDSDGKITVNGKEVNKVLVNGQVFFSSDPKVATKSLPKEIIDKIQISDTKSKTQEFTGDDGDGENKTINLTIKKDKNKGYMGRAAAGYGTDERYQANGILNYFRDKERVSILATSNNINNAGFSFDEIYDMVGNTNGGYSFANDNGLINNFGRGITTSSSLGASYANAEKDAYEIDANYFFAYSDSFDDQKTARENILPEGSFFTNSESRFDGSTNSNRGAANLEFDIDKTMRISIQPTLSVNRTNSVNISETTSSDTDGNLTNSNQRQTITDGMQRNFNNEVNIYKKLDTVGKFVRVSFSNTNVVNDNESNFMSTREVFGNNANEESVDQMNFDDTKRDDYRFEAAYRQPIAAKVFLDFEYQWRTQTNQNKKDVFDFDNTTNEYDNFNAVLSTDFTFRNIQQIPSFGIRRDGEKWRWRVNAEYAFTDIKNSDFLQTGSFKRNYNNLLFNASSSYAFSNNKRLRLNYRTNLNVPSVGQLQPVPNISNPLNIIQGNPDLNLTKTHRLNINYNNFNWRERTGVYLYSGGEIEEDKVVSVTTTDEDFLRTTTFTNVDGNYNMYFGFGYSKQLKKDSTFTAKVNFRPFLRYNNDVSFNNGQELVAKSFTVNPYLSTTLNFSEIVEIEPAYRISYNNTKYNIESFEDVEFVSHTASLRTTTYWPENVVWGNDINYNYNGNVSANFDKDALFWNMSLGYQFLKKNATFKVLAYDLLNQNNNARRTTGADFIQDSQSTVLTQYFMASLSFKFDQFGGKKPNGRRGRY
ncbi:outer membrane beta-barrel protein [Galbibacter mesophilus]|uniref:outer membrane beta-barrel protein n=1 Tax=Galbibacter mesophilus TaxID=379069 RepID=UPI00191EC048|nr:outer membrane beta-barrel protein [Galbibacter mesophilus]MCM5663702.1 outer membrane beta-barrel protein [Galbibacter mesophilus]